MNKFSLWGLIVGSFLIMTTIEMENTQKMLNNQEVLGRIPPGAVPISLLISAHFIRVSRRGATLLISLKNAKQRKNYHKQTNRKK